MTQIKYLLISLNSPCGILPSFDGFSSLIYPRFLSNFIQTNEFQINTSSISCLSNTLKSELRNSFTSNKASRNCLAVELKPSALSYRVQFLQLSKISKYLHQCYNLGLVVILKPIFSVIHQSNYEWPTPIILKLFYVVLHY